MFYLFSSPDGSVSCLSYLTFAFSFTPFLLSWLFTFCKEKLEFCKEKAPEPIPLYIQQIWQDDAKRVRSEELRVKSEERRVIFSLHSSPFSLHSSLITFLSSLITLHFHRASLFFRFSFVSGPRSDGGGSALCGMRAGRGSASRKPSPHKGQRA